ncbi:MAG: zinc ribbon domain-containing protein [Armatimonadetes bacterium]|nr:zinc ribbon domain-containing protein [Armatimonadota bacterium]NOG93163.1 zinc ribbon domain-containing protein [Armatimonadota bacterium]
MVCPNCGVQGSDGAQFCGGCGTRLLVADAGPRGWTTDAAPQDVEATRTVSRARRPKGSTQAEFGPMHGIVLASGLGFLGCFLPAASGAGVDVTIMKIAAEYGIVYLLPGAFLFSGIVGIALIRDLVASRAGWRGLLASLSGLALGMTVLAWPVMFSSGPNIGLWLPVLASLGCTILACRELFAET